MLFSIILIFIAFAASALAALSTPSRTLQGRTDCEMAQCAFALAGDVLECVVAVVQDGLNPKSDVSCLEAAVSTVLNFPASCDQCLEAYGINNPTAISSASVSRERSLGYVLAELDVN
ncbi:hypothetical protein FIBSPDRAFT_951602 [Athelia psychrophila]|uniref:Fungal calcium binding protein domain-containing protein n=1 Tax=Athelia psychrophila TaxID=1759441 RepID=A0A166MHN5_9AGAM|nr:hypothetical protein FIBSPDRAFT_951602 [Fibularhizoctonia sp. CBS 109695]